MKFSSQILADAVDAFARLPGIGKKTALRTILHLAQQDKGLARDLISTLQQVTTELQECAQCHSLSDRALCGICSDTSRRHDQICVVGTVRDVMAIEDTNQYRGLYHVLGGVISPIDGIGPEQLHIDSLIDRIAANGQTEVIMAINPTIEGETTIYYLSRKLRTIGASISVLARGISFGGELEYADEVTLGKSILTRTPYILTED
ncbi:MAG: recombination mediator RecR [Saprospiraceae bacterium]|nr:recombination mediator RecR [Saprospiraceae bacterium]